MDYLEFRANVYLPSTKKFFYDNKVSSSYRNAAEPRKVEIKTTNNKYFEQALRGFDVDLGSQIPGLEALTVRVAYYHFGFNNKTDTRHGARFSANYQIFSMLDLDAEISYDNQRKLTYFGGLTLNYQFDGGKKQNMTRLQQKMNVLPIRDIDAVTGSGSIDTQESAEFQLHQGAVGLVAHGYDGSVDVVEIDDNGVISVTTSRPDAMNKEVSNRITALGDVLQTSKIVVLGTGTTGEIYDVNDTDDGDRLSTARPAMDEADLQQRASVLAGLATGVVPSHVKTQVVDSLLTTGQKKAIVQRLEKQVNFIEKEKVKIKEEVLKEANILKVKKMLQVAKHRLDQESMARQAEAAENPIIDTLASKNNTLLIVIFLIFKRD